MQFSVASLPNVQGLWTVGVNLTTCRGPARSRGDLHVQVMSPQSNIRASAHVRGLVSFRQGISMFLLAGRERKGLCVRGHVGKSQAVYKKDRRHHVIRVGVMFSQSLQVPRFHSVAV